MAEKQHRRHFCSHCGRTFGKAEHLSRHERTHTGSKPFRCSVCKQSFSRQDSLSRHQKRHESESRAFDATSLNGEEEDHDLRPHRSSVGTATPQHLNHNSDTVDDLGTDFQLNWPDSEDLLQSILSADFDTWPAFTAPDLPTLDNHNRVAEAESPWVQFSTGLDSSHTGQDAVSNLSRLITSVPANITTEAQSTGLTTTFLDDSLLMFWTKFVPTFPVVHEPTFIFKDWTYPLLLNAIALGSLFTGRETDKIKGEILWRLAHTSVATSWHSLIKHKGPYDACCGIQLVLTALLGQTYAILSKNASIRMTAAIFHSLGFFWAQETGMYNFETRNDLLAIEDGNDSQRGMDRWRRWAARETQLRALLGHYILDGHISQVTGGPTCQKHTTSTLRLPASREIFASTTREEWAMKMRSYDPYFHPLWKIFSFTFSSHTPVKHLANFQSALGADVILEGIRSLIPDTQVGLITVVGIPSRREITFALGRFYARVKSSEHLTITEKSQIGLRWHAIFIDLATGFNGFCHKLCRNYKIRQTTFRGRTEDCSFDVDEWSCSAAGRRSLLSAIAIHGMVSSLPLGNAPSTHMAASIFMAAMIYCGMLIAGVRVVSVPQDPDFETIIMLHDDHGNLLDAEVDHGYLCYFNGLEVANGISKNLRYDINMFFMSLKNISEVWGVAVEMHNVLRTLLSVVDSAEV